MFRTSVRREPDNVNKKLLALKFVFNIDNIGTRLGWYGITSSSSCYLFRYASLYICNIRKPRII